MHTHAELSSWMWTRHDNVWIYIYIYKDSETHSIWLCYVCMSEWIHRHKWEYLNHILGLENILKMKMLTFIWIHRWESDKSWVIETRVPFSYFSHFVIDVKKDKKPFALRSALSLEDNGAGRLSMTALTWLWSTMYVEGTYHFFFLFRKINIFQVLSVDYIKLLLRTSQIDKLGH